jgi:hypothetical protein
MNGITVAEPLLAQDVTWQDGDRRRPGRVDYESPELVNLFRGTAAVKLDSAADVLRPEGEATLNNAIEWAEDDLGAFRGILTAALVSLGCWVTVGAVVWFF